MSWRHIIWASDEGIFDALCRHLVTTGQIRNDVQ